MALTNKDIDKIESLIERRLREELGPRPDSPAGEGQPRTVWDALRDLTGAVEQLVQAQTRTEQRMEELVQAQARTEQRVEELAQGQAELVQAQVRTEQRVEELAQAQARTEQRVEELAQAQARTEQRVEELAQAQARTEQRVEELAQAQTRTETAIRALARQVGGLSETVGGDIEDVAYIVLHDVLKREFGWKVGVLERTWQRWDGEPEEVNIFGRASDPEDPGREIWVVGEAKHNLTAREVERFGKQLARARAHLPGEIFPVCFCYRARPEVQEALCNAGIRLVFSYGKLV